MAADASAAVHGCRRFRCRSWLPTLPLPFMAADTPAPAWLSTLLLLLGYRHSCSCLAIPRASDTSCGCVTSRIPLLFPPSPAIGFPCDRADGALGLRHRRSARHLDGTGASKRQRPATWFPATPASMAFGNFGRSLSSNVLTSSIPADSGNLGSAVAGDCGAPEDDADSPASGAALGASGLGSPGSWS